MIFFCLIDAPGSESEMKSLESLADEKDKPHSVLIITMLFLLQTE